jgi:hypothetical protein
MRSTLFALLLSAPLTGYAVEQIIPAGSLVQCTVSEPKLSSKTTDVGDPVLCQVGHLQISGRSSLPYGSYLQGRFEDYKDPGHLVGKGWMELKFDRMFIPPGQVIAVSAKVVYVPKMPVDKQGRIHGKGHPVRDSIEWLIPVLWPIDLINLPRRGPRPVLKAETRLTLKVMDDFGVPIPEPSYQSYQPSYAPRDQYGYSQRAPMTYTPPPAPAPPAPRQINYTAVPLPPPPTVLALRDGHRTLATQYWYEGDHAIGYVGLNGAPVVFPAGLLDVATTVAINQSRGVNFVIRAASY